MIRRTLIALGAAASLTVMAAPLLFAQAAKKPADATAECKDGSYSKAKTERGACSGHGGVATWFGDAKTDAKTTKATAAPSQPAPKTASAPADATGQCKDGSYTTAKSQRGACSGHGGV